MSVASASPGAQFPSPPGGFAPAPRPVDASGHRADPDRFRDPDHDYLAGAGRGQPGTEHHLGSRQVRRRLFGAVPDRASRGAPVRSVRRPADPADRRAAQRPRTGADPPTRPRRRTVRRLLRVARAVAGRQPAGAVDDAGHRRFRGGAGAAQGLPPPGPLQLHAGPRRTGVPRHPGDPAVQLLRGERREDLDPPPRLQHSARRVREDPSDHLLRVGAGREARPVHHRRQARVRHRPPPAPATSDPSCSHGWCRWVCSCWRRTSARRCCCSAPCS